MIKLLSITTAIFLVVSTYSQNLYDIDNITEIYITFDDQNWDATMDTYYANDQDELLFGSCTINGESFDSVGVAFKGNSTYHQNNLKNPLKIKLAEIYSFQHYHGCRTLKLSNGDKDPSFVREVLSYEIGRKYMDMPLSNFAKVYINSSYYGLFVSSESINGDFIEKRFYSDDDNVRIKCNPVSVQEGSSLKYLGSDSSLYYDYYELKSDFGWADLIDLCYQVHYNTATLEEYLDVDRTLWMLAFNNVLVNLDSYTGPFRQNYYLIKDDHGRFNPVIWDLNQSIGSFSMVNSGGGPPGPTSLSDLTEMDPYLRETDLDFPLIYYLFSNNRYRKMYIAHCKTILEENFSNDWYYTRAQILQAIIETEVQSEPNGFYTYAQFTGNLDTQQGGGMGGGIYGLSQVMNDRVVYLSNHAAFNYTTPIISAITPSNSNPSPNSTINITANIQNADYAYLGYRSYKGDHFKKLEMFDDGLHNDSAALDGIWRVSFAVGAANVQYYIYADNADAGRFSPERAEHEFYELSLSHDVVINELMASNNITASDEYGEFNDWIELYNNSGSAIDLGGYFLSDDSLNHYKWTIPSGTMINANDYLIIWADNDLDQIPLHANFKLTASGETIYFSDPLGNLINEVQYPKVEDNGTYGRYPNGTGGFIPMYATYSAENSFTSIGIEEREEIPNISLYPNPASDYFVLNFEGQELLDVVVYTLSGAQLLHKKMSSGEIIECAHWQKGTYIVTIPEKSIADKIIVH